MSNIIKNDIFDNDEHMEAAIIKSWLLFNHHSIRRNRDKFFNISVLTVVMNGDSDKDMETICKEYKLRYGSDVTKERIRQAIDLLVGDKIVIK